MTFREYTVDDLVDVLRRAGFVECDIAACNCGAWHHRYGLPERWSEIQGALRDAGVLNNETGNLPIRAVAKLVEQRDAIAARLVETKTALCGLLDNYVALVNSGDAGNWDCEIEPEVIAARRALTLGADQ